jgi:hypothetical protein
MLKKIQVYYPDVEFTSKTYKTFIKEHSEFSKLSALLKKATLIKLIYDNTTINTIETPIITKDNEELFPFLLKEEHEYIEEGSFMHHCVGEYINRNNSIIISLRAKHDDDRVTIEFDNNNGRLVQARHFQNNQYPEKFKDGVEELKKRVMMLLKQDKLKHVLKKHIPNPKYEQPTIVDIEEFEWV